MGLLTIFFSWTLSRYQRNGSKLPPNLCLQIWPDWLLLFKCVSTKQLNSRIWGDRKRMMLTIAAATEGGWACWPLLCKIGSSQREEGRVWTWIKCELLFTSCLHEPDWGLIAVLRHRHFKVGRMGPRSSSVTCPKSHNSPLVDSGLRLRPVCLEAQAFPILLSLVHPTL